MLLARSGDLGTLKAVEAPHDASVTLPLASGAFFNFQGKITDQDGAPLPNVAVTLFRGTKIAGLEKLSSAVTDVAGHYEFLSHYRDALYSLQAKASGYTQAYYPKLTVTPESTTEVPALSLTKLDSVASGVIVDSHGSPIAGATVQVDDVPDAQVVTGADGRFRVAGAARGKTFVRVTGPGDLQGGDYITSGNDASIVRIQTKAELDAAINAAHERMAADPTNHGDGTDASMLLKTAQSKATKDGKSILLVFHATWCGPCFRLHQFLEDPEIHPVLEKYFVVQDLDIWEEGDKKKWENPGGAALYEKYDGAGGIPFYALLNASGEKLSDSCYQGQNIGMPTDTAGIQFVVGLLRKAQHGLTDSEAATLKEGLKRHSAH